MGKAYDWDGLRRDYVIGDDLVTYRSMSEVPGNPAHQSIKNRARLEDWPGQRKHYRYKQSTLEEEEITKSTATQKAMAKVDRIVDTAEMITRHTQTSKWLVDIGKRALEDAEAISPHVAVQLIKLGLEGERICMGLDSDRTSQSFNPDDLSDEDLQKIADS